MGCSWLFIPLKRYFLGFDPSTALSLSLLLWLAVICSAARLNCCAFSGCWHRSKWRFNLWGWQLKAPQIMGDRSLARFTSLYSNSVQLWFGTSEPCGYILYIYNSNHCKTTSWEVPNNYVKSQFFNAFGCSANDPKRMPFEHWQASSTTVHSSISGRFNGVDTNLAYPELTSSNSSYTWATHWNMPLKPSAPAEAKLKFKVFCLLQSLCSPKLHVKGTDNVRPRFFC